MLELWKKNNNATLKKIHNIIKNWKKKLFKVFFCSDDFCLTVSFIDLTNINLWEWGEISQILIYWYLKSEVMSSNPTRWQNFFSYFLFISLFFQNNLSFQLQNYGVQLHRILEWHRKLFDFISYTPFFTYSILVGPQEMKHNFFYSFILRHNII